MANSEHLAILKKGADLWNEWREENPEIRPDLISANLKNIDLSHMDLTDINFKSANLMGSNLSSADLVDSNLEGANLDYVNLRGSYLVGVHLMNASLYWSILEGADLKGAHLVNARFFAANLIDSDLKGADLTNAELLGAKLQGADLTDAKLKSAKLRCAKLMFANLSCTDLRSADLTLANLEGANLVNANLEGANLEAVTIIPRIGAYRGIRLDGCYGNERVKRQMQHQALIEEIRSAGVGNKWLVGIWAVLADCGRTPWAWIGWSIFFCMYYAVIYSGLGADAFSFNAQVSLPFNFGTTLYYSVVTFTTLGFGDVTPATGLAAFYVTLEVITGYVMLGGLISFIFSKLLPR